VKSYLKKVISKKISKNENAIVVASCGRSGSTMLTESLALSSIEYGVGYIEKKMADAVTKWDWDLKTENLERGYIHKTHDYPPKSIEIEGAKFIYVYADPYEVVYSTIRKFREEGQEWIREHAKHMKSEICSVEEIMKADALGLENNFDAWRNISSKNVMILNYENIWNRRGEISEFVGYDVKIPKKKERRSSKSIVSEKEQKMIKKVYKSMHVKVENEKKMEEYAGER